MNRRPQPFPGPASGSAPLSEATTKPVGVFKLAEADVHKPPIIEPALTIDDVCEARNESRRTGERERSAGLWPKPDFYVGTGSRKSPRWLAATIRRWLQDEAEKIGRGTR